MPKNKGKGGKNRKRGTNKNEPVKRELKLKEEGQEYAQCTRMLGNGRIDAMCFDGVKRLGNIRGKMRKKVWVNMGDIVLVGLRDFQDSKCDVIMKYLPDEARQLQKKGLIPQATQINDEDRQEDKGWAFDDEGGEDSDDDGIAPQILPDSEDDEESEDEDFDVDNI